MKAWLGGSGKGHRHSNSGAYLALGVRDKQGFDIVHIQREITDYMEPPGLGMCYRVVIPNVGDIWGRDDVRRPLHCRPSTSPLLPVDSGF